MSEVETLSDDSQSSGGTNDPDDAQMSDPGQTVDIEPEVLPPAWSNLSQPSLRSTLNNEMLDDTMRLRRPRAPTTTSSSSDLNPDGGRPVRYSPYPLASTPEETYHLSAKFFDFPTDTHNYTNLATEIAFNVDFSEVQSGVDLDRLVESCFVISAARKRRVEIRVHDLTDRETLGFRAAKKKEFAQWISNKVAELAVRHGVPHARVIRRRWVLTFKDDETPPEKLTLVPDANSVPASDVTEDMAKLGTRSCKARLVLRTGL